MDTTMLRKRTAQIRTDFLISTNPSKNYMLNLLANDIARSGARRSLDAGSGRLRNFWMFNSEYVGIGLSVENSLGGLNDAHNAPLIAQRGAPELYLMRLENDFSFLGDFDLCVCTGTIFYVKDPVDAVRRLSDRVRIGGELIVTDFVKDGRLPEYLAVLKENFSDTSVTYWGYGDLDGFEPTRTNAEVLALTTQEMSKDNISAGHAQFYLRASGKRHAPSRPLAAPPDLLNFRGLRIVKADIPHLLHSAPLGDLAKTPPAAPEIPAKDEAAILAERKKTAAFVFSIDGKVQKAHESWFRGTDVNFNPTKENFTDPDAIEKFILKGWMPAVPFLTKQDKITAFGSCFAAHITNYLADNGYSILTKGNSNAYIVSCGEGMVNTYALLQQFEWAFEGKQFSQGLWHGYDTQEYGYDETIRRNTLGIFQQTDIFIVTIGLSEVWYDKLTGEVFWRAIPVSKFDPERHGFRVATHEENRANIERIYQIVRKHKPNARLLFTLSPIPLVATFRPVSCISANAVSKAILRSALDEVLRAHAEDPKLHYFPSYEIVTNAFRDSFTDDRRHVHPEILDLVMSAFERFFCIGDSAAAASKYYIRLAAALRNDQQIAVAELAQARA